MKKRLIVVLLSFLSLSIFSSGAVKDSTGFKVSGIKGFIWTPEQYVEEAPVLKEMGLNFMVSCYGSFFKNFILEKGNNDWWNIFNGDLGDRWEKALKACDDYGLIFCFGQNPMLYSSRPLDPDSEEDFQILLKNYEWFQQRGVTWFYLALDDLHLHSGLKVDGVSQATFASRLYHALLKNDPNCRFIFCPTWYTGAAISNPDKLAYLHEVSQYLDKDIYTFWTGPDVVSKTVTVQDAIDYKKAIGHELILWHNAPVNDYHNTLNLGPIEGLDPNLCNHIYGIIANPMRDNRISRLPLYTFADYVNDPQGYDPTISIKKAVSKIASDNEEELALQEMVSFYPGVISKGYTSTKYSIVRMSFENLLGEDSSKAEEMLKNLEKTYERFDSAFPDTFEDSKIVVRNDITWMYNRLGRQLDTYSVGAASVSLEPGNMAFSTSIQGYGAPAEGRFSLEWIPFDNAPSSLHFSGNGDTIFCLAPNGDLSIAKSSEEKFNWQYKGSTNPVTLLAGATPESFKLVSATNDELYAISLDNHLSRCDRNTSTMDWKVLGKAPDAIALTSHLGHLFAADPMGNIWRYDPSNGKWITFDKSGKSITSITSDGEFLYVLTENQRLWQCREGQDGLIWTKIAYINGVTWEKPVSQIFISGGNLYAVGLDNTLYHSQNKTLGDMKVGCLVIDDGNRKVAIISADMCAIEYEHSQKIKTLIKEKYDIDPENVLINASHSHYTPVSRNWFAFGDAGFPDPKYLQLMTDRFVECVGEALENRKESKIYFTQTSSVIGHNRSLRFVGAPYDPLVNVVSFFPVDGSRPQILVEAACHPVFPNAGENRYTLSSNYVGVMRRLVESKTGAEVFFLQGCAGDTDPLVQDFNMTGETLGNDVVAAIDKKDSQQIKGRIFCSGTVINFKLNPASKKEVRAFRDENSNRSNDIEAEKNVRWANEMLRKYNTHSMPKTEPLYIQNLIIGNWRLTGISDEMTSEYALRLREGYSGEFHTICAYSNDVRRYVATPLHFKNKTYESSSSFYWYGLPSAIPVDLIDDVVKVIR